MDLSRRDFLASAAGAISLPWPRLARVPTSQPTGLVLPVDCQCSLPESVHGYRSVLVAGPSPRLVVFPAVVELPSHAVQAITTFLRHGWTVIVESGAGFSGHGDFRRHRQSLRDGLGLDVQAPVDLWSNASTRVPYVDYRWPAPAKVRDFTRVVPLGSQEGEIIASADGVPVALRRQVGPGTLIFLGSPLGPALWAGDREGRCWLCALKVIVHSIYQVSWLTPTTPNA